MKDDYQLEGGAYTYDDADGEEWNDEDAAWDGQPEQENTPEGEAVDATDESTVYLEFLNKEVTEPPPGLASIPLAYAG